MRILVLLVVVLFGLIAAAVALDLDLSKLAHLFKSDEFSVAKTTGDEKSAASSSDNKSAKLPADQVTTMSAPEGFDIARVTPGGVSVFAGRTDPKTDITVVADGQPIGSVKSDANGEWVLVSEHKFPNSEPALSVKPGNLLPEKPDVKVAAAETAKEPHAKKQGEKTSSAKRVTSELIRDLEGLVEMARRENRPDKKATTPASETAAATRAAPETGVAGAATNEPAKPAAQGDEAKSTTADTSSDSEAQQKDVATAAAAVTPEQPVGSPNTAEPAQVAAASVATPAAKGTEAAGQTVSDQAAQSVDTQNQPGPASKTAASENTSPADTGNAAQTTVAAATSDVGTSQSAAAGLDDDSLPVPIKFIYREAVFTEEGQRAAELLLEYLKLKQFKLIKLSGHADERGTEELNRDLSRERLKTVETFLRRGGYEGEMELTPKGESEPFSGVDRKKFSLHDLYELDRRVELRLPR